MPGKPLPPYRWPVEPFDRMHPVRGYLNDPRDGALASAFHFGIDVSGPDGTPVFSVEPGDVHLEGPQNTSVVSSSSARTFSYWHVVHVVKHRQQVKKGDLLGHIGAGWGHVHFAERLAGATGAYVNPLRPGALTPFAPAGAPHVQRIVCSRGGVELNPAAVNGPVDVIVEAFDRPPLPVPPPWANMPVTVASIRWRLMQGAKVARPWATPVQLGEKMLPKETFGRIYAPGTHQNHPNAPGLYRYFLAHTLSTRLFPDGDYRIEVEASNLHGTKASGALGITIANGV